MQKQIQQLFYSYGRSVVGAVLAVYMTGATNLTDYIKAGVAALIPPLMRWVNPNDAAFGVKK
jgi:hypothetical protein